MNENPRASYHASLGAALLIGLGSILFIDNLGLLPFANLRAYWPMAIAAFGVAQLTRARSACAMVWPWTIVAAGVLLTLGNLGFVHVNIGNIWPIFLIAAGMSMLFRRPGRVRPAVYFTAPDPRATGGRPFRNLDANAIFSSVDRRIDTANFERADLNAFFGELKVDLRGATIGTPNREAIVETNAAFGAIKLRIPETWKVVVQGNAVFGAYQDKTVPPRPGPGIDPPLLIVNGNSAFGAVEIEN